MLSPVRERKCSKEKAPSSLSKGSKRICIPVERAEYDRILAEDTAFREYLDTMIEQYPELFPAAIQQGYYWHDMLPPSKKMPGMRMRRIKLKEKDAQDKPQVFTIAPSFVMPYMTGYTDALENALFLRRFGVPYWALTHVYGHDDMYWERHMERLGRYDLVGTTIKSAEKLPQHLLADEKHTRLNGEKAYIATTVGDDCVLGVSVAIKADTPHLTEAYGHVKEEMQRLDPEYQPETVNTDVW